MSVWIKLLMAFNLLLFFIVLFFAVAGRSWVRNFIREKVIGVRHHQLKSMFEAAPVSTGAIIFLGDSITEGGNWAELFPGKNILNRGIGGDVTKGVLARLDEVVRHQPSKLFIAIGTNDLAMGFSNADILNNYRAIIQRVKTGTPATKIYVQSVLPVGKWGIFGHKNSKIQPFNKELQTICAEMGVPFIDLYPHFLDAEGYLDKQYSNDNLHLMGNAYVLWKKLIEGEVDG